MSKQLRQHNGRYSPSKTHAIVYSVIMTAIVAVILVGCGGDFSTNFPVVPTATTTDFLPSTPTADDLPLGTPTTSDLPPATPTAILIPTASATAAPKIIERNRNFTYHERMAVKKPSTVLFALTAPTITLSPPPTSMSEDNGPVEIVPHDDLDIFVSMELNATGATVIERTAEVEQRLSDHSNQWSWDVTPLDNSSQVVLIPKLTIRQKDKVTGRIVIEENNWSGRYFVNNVSGESFWDYLREHFIYLLAALLGSGGITGIATLFRRTGSTA